MEEHLSNYEWKCAKCGQPIKPKIPYHLRKRYTNYQGKRENYLDRVHVECPQNTVEEDDDGD